MNSHEDDHDGICDAAGDHYGVSGAEGLDMHPGLVSCAADPPDAEPNDPDEDDDDDSDEEDEDEDSDDSESAGAVLKEIGDGLGWDEAKKLAVVIEFLEEDEDTEGFFVDFLLRRERQEKKGKKR